MTWDDDDLEVGVIPLWFQIADRLRLAIDKGFFSPGDTLPGELSLTQRFNISRTTARTALNHLETEGRILRRSGRGSIVLEQRVDQPLNLLSSFSEDMRARGHQASYHTRSIKRTKLSSEVAHALALSSSSYAVVINRVLCAAGSPIAISLSWIPGVLLRGHHLPSVTDLDTGSLYNWLESTTSMRIAFGDEFIEANSASSEVADALEIQVGSPVLVARRTSRSLHGDPMEYVILHYRSDRYRFHVELARP